MIHLTHYKDKTEEQVNQMDSEHAEEKLRVQVVPAGAVAMATQKPRERLTSCKLMKRWTRIMIYYTSEKYRESLDSGIILTLFLDLNMELKTICLPNLFCLCFKYFSESIKFIL